VASALEPLSLQEAHRIAGKESPAVRLSEIELEEARLAFEDAKANLILRPSVLALRQAESALEAAQAKWELARRDLAMQVEQAYYDVLRTQTASDLAQRFVRCVCLASE
jgi:outer membrane protein TolC